jgi:hypothetical protein
VQLLGHRVWGDLRRAVGGRESVGAAVAQAAKQVANGAWSEAQRLGDGGRRLTPEKALPESLSHREG